MNARQKKKLFNKYKVRGWNYDLLNQFVYRFPNGYTVSVIKPDFPYSKKSKVLEIGVLDSQDELDSSGCELMWRITSDSVFTFHKKHLIQYLNEIYHYRKRVN